jgi:hypothetical protein
MLHEAYDDIAGVDQGALLAQQELCRVIDDEFEEQPL